MWSSQVNIPHLTLKNIWSLIIIIFLVGGYFSNIANAILGSISRNIASRAQEIAVYFVLAWPRLSSFRYHHSKIGKSPMHGYQKIVGLQTKEQLKDLEKLSIGKQLEVRW